MRLSSHMLSSSCCKRARRSQRQPSFRIRTVNHPHLVDGVLGLHPRSGARPSSNSIDKFLKLPAVGCPRRMLAILLNVRSFGPILDDFLICFISDRVIFCYVDSMPERGYDVGPECYGSLDCVLLRFGKCFVLKDNFAMLGRAHWCTKTWPFAGEPWERITSSHGHICRD